MQNRKIAIIDNDKNFLVEIEEILTMCGYVPVAISDPLLVEDILVRSKPDVALIELRMLKENGFKFTDMVNRIFQASKMSIIAMSDFLSDEFRLFLDLYAKKKWLRKSFQPLDVIWAIENVADENGCLWEREGCLAETGIMTQAEGDRIVSRNGYIV